MEPKEYEKMFILEKKHWWFYSKRRFVHTVLEKFLQKNENLRILDVGCGTGVMLSELNEYGNTIGIDTSKEAIKFCKKRKIKNVKLSRADKLPFRKESFDLVLALDVIEHLSSDLEALKEFKRACKKDGFLLVTVPAFEFLWSPHDDVLCHKRRYTRKELVRKIRFSGFKIVKSTYLFSILFPFIAIVKIGGRLFKRRTESEVGEFSKPVNDFLIKILRLEAYLIRYVNLPFGSSILCLARNEDRKVKEEK